jgi:ubiquinone/menaquinone biosynthesis C-methylase UbiE
MATGEKIETRGHIVGFREEIDVAACRGKDAFFTWFDNAQNADMAFQKGQWDFKVHIDLPLSEYISDPENKIALEIGHGGGRILLAACRSFKKVIGIDVHRCNKLVEAELKNRGVSNFELFETDGSMIPVKNSAVDIVYSFIVLQHVEKIDTFKRYLEETHRVLKPGGVAVLYFGRRRFYLLNSGSYFNHLIDCFFERLLLTKGFKELPAKVNCKNLVISLRYAEKLAQKCGFITLKRCVSRKKAPDGVSLYGEQHGLILRKP